MARSLRIEFPDHVTSCVDHRTAIPLDDGARRLLDADDEQALV